MPTIFFQDWVTVLAVRAELFFVHQQFYRRI